MQVLAMATTAELPGIYAYMKRLVVEDVSGHQYRAKKVIPNDPA